MWSYGRRRYISHKVEAKKQVLRKLGTQEAWGASGATGYCSEAVAAFVGTWNAGEEEPSVERVLGRVAEDLREKPVVLPSGEEVRFTFSGGVYRWRVGDEVQEMLTRADDALYRAKIKGGGVIVHAD